MQPQALFLMTVQALIITQPSSWGWLLEQYFSEASELPEEAYANASGGAVRAATAWWSWRTKMPGHPKPDWLEAHEEARRNLVVVRRKKWVDPPAATVQAWATLLAADKSERDLVFSPEIRCVVEDVPTFREARVSRAEGERFRHWAMANCRQLGVECPFEFEADPPL